MAKIDPDKFKLRYQSKKQPYTDIFSRLSIDGSLAVATSEDFRQHMNIPPETVPEVPLSVDSLEFASEAIYIGGRYCKYSRVIGQSPWLHENTNITECVQEFIFAGIEKVLG